MAFFASGMIAGFLLCRLLVEWAAMWRVCCREHYASHATCTCRDCMRDRETA